MKKNPYYFDLKKSIEQKAPKKRPQTTKKILKLFDFSDIFFGGQPCKYTNK